MGLSNVRGVSVATGTADVDPDTAGNEGLVGPCTLFGWSLRESAAVGAAATIILRDGRSDADTDIIAVIEIAANGAGTQWFGPQGIRVNSGVYIDRVAGETEGVVYIG